MFARSSAPLRRAFLAAFASILLAGVPVPGSADDLYFERKDWRASFDGQRCRIWTGGDGSGTVAISIDPLGYNVGLDYDAVVYRGYPSPLTQDVDEVDLMFDGRPAGLIGEMYVHQGYDAYNHPTAGAALTAGFVIDAIRQMRAGSRLDVFRSNYRTGERGVIDSFSLSGFTATYLKISEWCRFHPDHLPQS